MLPDAKRRHLGPLGMSGSTNLPSWSEIYAANDLEHAPDLMWKPDGKGMVEEYHRMRTDAQVQGLYLGSTLPIRRYEYVIEPNGARPEWVDKISRGYNLPIKGQEDRPVGRRKRRFVFQDHLRHALLAILYGHMYFEQVGEIDPGDKMWYMRKLGVRMPQSIRRFRVAEDGGLAGIVQRGSNGAGGEELFLDINRIVGYIWDQEGGNWAGRSMLRGIRKNFLLKDTVLRLGAINIERAGGVPVITGPKGATPEDLAELGKMARTFRVGANSGGSIPHGAQLDLARAAGGEETVQYLKLQNEEMSRGWLMMFLNLGQATTGSYALGSTLLDYALSTQEVIAQWVCDTFNEHVVEDDIDWNFPDAADEPVPLVVFKRTDNRDMALADLAQMVDRGIIQVDDELEAWLRETYRLPRRDPDSPVRAVSRAGSPLVEPPAGASAIGGEA